MRLLLQINKLAQTLTHLQNLTLQVLTAITVLTKLIQVILILKTIVLQINNHLIQMLQAVINLLIITIPAVTPHLIQITIA